MIAEVDRREEAGETLGGTIVVAARGVPVGLGSYVQWTEKLDGRIAQAILSIHAVKAVARRRRRGCAAHRSEGTRRDLLQTGGRYHRTTNRAGGLEGGVDERQESSCARS